MPYKYSFLVTTIELEPGIGDLTSEEISHGFTQEFGSLGPAISQDMQQVTGGPWEAISHSVTGVERHLVITVMLRGEQ